MVAARELKRIGRAHGVVPPVAQPLRDRSPGRRGVASRSRAASFGAFGALPLHDREICSSASVRPPLRGSERPPSGPSSGRSAPPSCGGTVSVPVSRVRPDGAHRCSVPSCRPMAPAPCRVPAPPGRGSDGCRGFRRRSPRRYHGGPRLSSGAAPPLSRPRAARAPAGARALATPRPGGSAEGDSGPSRRLLHAEEGRSMGGRTTHPGPVGPDRPSTARPTRGWPSP